MQRISTQTILFRLYNDAILSLYDATGKLQHHIFKRAILSQGVIEITLKNGRTFTITCTEKV